MSLLPQELHFSHRIGWLRAAVMDANDGMISVAILVIGVAVIGATIDLLLVTEMAGLVAGAVSMAAGEYVLMQSQADTEQGDLRKEAHEFKRNPEFKLQELSRIYIERGRRTLAGAGSSQTT